MTKSDTTDRTVPVIIQPLTPSWMALLFPGEFRPGESWADERHFIETVIWGSTDIRFTLAHSRDLRTKTIPLPLR
jgi:hypothetical protein